MKNLTSLKLLKYNLFSYTINCSKFLIKYYHHKRLSNNFLEQFLTGHSFSTNRIRYDAIRVSTIIGNFFEALSNQKLTTTDIENLYLAGAITPIADEFCDKYNFNDGELYQIVKKEQFTSDNPKVGLFTKLLKALRIRKNYGTLLESNINQLLDIQVNSKIQKSTKELSTIKRITYKKGGQALLFYASCTDCSFSKEQSIVIDSFGCFVQLLDDIFDIGQDLDEGNNTLATLNISNIDNIFNEFYLVLTSNLAEIKTLQIPEKNKLKIFNTYSLLVVPTLSYLSILEKASRKNKLLNTDDSLNEKYIWKSWNLNSIIQLIKTLIFS